VSWENPQSSGKWLSVQGELPDLFLSLALDDRLIEEARRIGQHKTTQNQKRSRVRAALAEHVKRRKQLRILDAFGTFEFDPKYNYKIERRKKRS
jgi:hypothetical protein